MMLSALQLTVSVYATAALRAGEDALRAVLDPAAVAAAAAGSSVSSTFAEALARVHAIPAEAWAAAEDLQGALARIFPEDDADRKGDAVQGELPADTGQAWPGPAGQSGPDAGTARPTPMPVPLPARARIDPEGLARFLRARHPEKTAEHVCALSRVPVDTVAKILSRQSLASGRTLLALIAVYGPDLLAALLPDSSLQWLAGAQVLADRAHLEAEMARAKAAIAANQAQWPFCGFLFSGSGP